MNGRMKMGSAISSSQFNQMLHSNSTCVLLNSRQSKRPSGADDWVRATALALPPLIALDHLFLTSVGMNTWELVLHLVNVHGGRQLIVIPPDSPKLGHVSAEGLVADFHLDEKRSDFYILESTAAIIESGWSQARDELLISRSDLVVPISVRPRGNMERLLANCTASIDNSCRTKYRKPLDRVCYDWTSRTINRGVKSRRKYITHWTRSANGPFPGQDQFNFYDSIRHSLSFPGSAFSALNRIILERRIRSSSRFIRGNHQVVSFTELEIEAALSLMRWRRRYACYSFEPYGIAIDCECAGRCGCRKAIYGSVADYSRLSEADRPFFQNAGSEVSDWTPEAEWRCVGDFDLESVPAEMIRIIVFEEREAAALRVNCPYEVISLTC